MSDTTTGEADLRTITAAGINFLTGTLAAESDQPPIICLHGIGGDARSFIPQITGLADHAVYSWSMPGYGGSEQLEEMSFASLCECLLAAMDALGLTRVVIAGQSIGGMIAQEMAIRFPHRVAGLILIATVPAFGGRDDSFKDQFLAARLAPLDNGISMETLAAKAIPAVMGNMVDDRACREAIAVMADIPQTAYRQVLSCLVTFNRRDDLHLITCPCCLIAGGKDDNSPARVMERMAERLVDASIDIIETAGHLVNNEATKTCNDVISGFMQRVN